MYVQLAFAIDRVKTLAPMHPEWRDRQPFKAVLDDKAGKPVAINQQIGRRFGLIVHHADAEHGYACDRKSPIGRLDLALDAAAANGWTLVDMKNDWKRIFRFD